MKYNEDFYLNDSNLREILIMQGEILTGENVISVNESMIDVPFESKKDVVFDISQNKIILKTDNQKKAEKLIKYQGYVLEKLNNVNIAIATQTAGNEVRIKKSKAAIYTISEDEIDTITEYGNNVATFHQTWNPDDFTLEEIDENIFNGGLVLPEIIKRLLK
jgi:hypothetical protein